MRFGAARLSSPSDSLVCVAQKPRLRVRWRTDDCPCLSSIALRSMVMSAESTVVAAAVRERTTLRCYDSPLGDMK